jgi:hypothetical protein
LKFEKGRKIDEKKKENKGFPRQGGDFVAPGNKMSKIYHKDVIKLSKNCKKKL